MARSNGPRSIGKEDNLAERIAYERDAAGLSYEALAKKMTDAGCSIQGSAIYKIEKGSPRRRVTVDELVAFSRVFEVSVENLLTPMAVLKQEWAEQRLRDLDEAETALAAACSDLGDVWMDIYRHGLIDALDGVDDEESVVAYLHNRLASQPEPTDPMLWSARQFGQVIQKLAAKLVVAVANEELGDGVVEVVEEEG